MNLYTVAFFGHRYIDEDAVIEGKLNDYIRQLLQEKEFVDFLIGRNGDFDQLVASTVRRAKKHYRDDNSSLILVLPYKTAEFSENQEGYADYYDCVEVSEKVARVFPKNAIQTRNREMIDRADLVIFYVEHQSGGAYQSLRYALKRGKRVINLCEKSEIK